MQVSLFNVFSLMPIKIKRESRMRHHEEIKFFSKPFLYILAAFVVIGLWMQINGISNAAMAIIFAVTLPLLFGRLLIKVSNNTLHISFGYLGIIKKDIPLSEIQEARVIEYKPLRQFGGWGIRSGKFEGKKTGCYSIKGNRGLLLSLTHKVRVCVLKTNQVIIGCNDPEKLKVSLGKEN
jgi:hypothetical protein